jgi:hypothetical protein
MVAVTDKMASAFHQNELSRVSPFIGASWTIRLLPDLRYRSLVDAGLGDDCGALARRQATASREMIITPSAT